MTDLTARLAARRLLRSALTASLGTVNQDGSPHVSFATHALRMGGAPLLLLSRLSLHTGNLQRDPRLALLISEPPRTEGDPMDSARVTLSGTVTVTRDPADRARYLRRHPAAELYAGFADFAFHVLEIREVHFVGGFARAASMAPEDLLLPAESLGPLAQAEAEIVEHMNGDHSEAVQLYATRLLRQPEAPWQMTGIDPEGCDLRAGNAVARLEFAAPVAGPAEARAELVRLARAARAA